ncbi:hypothetical protein HPB48_015042 [Haemaphysalis longicornis]|uniref:cyclin-dependent kinase n=1 Tax=Haemaphysalis longicornis TaxID=44386 RepID=A0A9J6FCG8_HAELO|nr:hypothetical protein HPB48_015042 [Haemaphysalis longicornis]
MDKDVHEKIHKSNECPNGVVYKARGRDTGRYVALKKIRLKNETHEVASTAIREISTLQDPRHPNGAHLLDVLQGNRQLYLVLEYTTEDLRKHMNEAASRKTCP